MLSERTIKHDLKASVGHFWNTRAGQASKQRSRGSSDQGARSAVTGGKQMDGFVSLVARIITTAGLSKDCLFIDKQLELPGYFRPEKKWDFVVMDDKTLVAAVEFKSQVGPSFGNNFNNRAEESIGTALDIWTAYRDGAFSSATRPWLGYLMLLEDCDESTTPVAVRESHFPVFRKFVGASYAMRYQELLIRLMKERLYDSATLVLSPKPQTSEVKYHFPNDNLHFDKFATALHEQVASYLSARK